MSAVARVFVVLNLLLSAGFMVAAATFVAMNNDYKSKLAKERAARAEEVQDITAKFNKATEELNDVRRALRTANEEKTRLDSLNTTLNQDLQTAQENLQKQVARLDELNVRLKELDTTANRAVDAWNRLKEENDELDQKARDAVTRLQATVKKLDEEQKAHREARNRIAEQSKMITVKDEQIKHLELIRDYAVRKGLDLEKFDQPPPGIRGSVINADNNLKLVLINKGSKDGLKRGHVLDIVRGSIFVGRMRVDDVRDGFATGLLTLLRDGQQVMTGDRVMVLN